MRRAIWRNSDIATSGTIARPDKIAMVIALRFSKTLLAAVLALAAPVPRLLGQGQTPAQPSAGKGPSGSLARAVALFDKKDYRQACRLFEAYAAHNPSSVPLQLHLLGCAIRQQDAHVIARERASLDRVAPAGAPVHAVAGDWLAAAGRCHQAEEEYALAPKAPEEGSVGFALAQCFQAAGDPEAALHKYSSAIELSPNKEEYRLSLAILLMTSGDYEQAGKVLVDAANRFPKSVRVLVTMSLLHLSLGYPDRARIGYEKARELAPDSPMVWKLLGQLQYAEGAYAEAVQSYQHAASAEPKDPQTYLFMGLAQMKLEDGADLALASFHSALELDPGLIEARVQAASIYLEHKADYRQAVAQLEKVTSAAPDFARAHFLLIQAYRRLGLAEKAAAEAATYRRLTEAPSAPPPPKSH